MAHPALPKRTSARLGAIFALLILFLTSGAGTAWADPDYSDDGDILNGFRRMADADDLGFFVPSSGGTTEYGTVEIDLVGSLYFTEDQQVSLTTTFEDSANCGGGSDYLPMQTRIAYPFDDTLNLIVVARPGGHKGSCNRLVLEVRDPSAPSASTEATSQSKLTMAYDSMQIGVGDFDRDGYDDILAMNAGGTFAVATAVDVNDPSQGFAFSTTNLASSAYTPQSEPSVGDLDGDGNMDVAWIGGAREDGASIYAFVATVCPGDVADTVCEGKSAFEVVVSSEAIALGSVYGQFSSQVTSADITDFEPTYSARIGNFVVGQGVGLAVVEPIIAADTSGSCSSSKANYVQASLYLWDAELTNPTESKTLTQFLACGSAFYIESILTDSAPLEWGGTDQLVAGVLHYDFEHHSVRLLVYDFTNGSIGSTYASVKCGDGTEDCDQIWLHGLTIGRFTDTDDIANTNDLDRQLAMVFDNSLYVYRATDDDGVWSLEQASSLSLGTSWVGPNSQMGSLLRTGDMQGRSLRLGQPSVLRVTTHLQPRVVLSAPPMMIDYIQPEGSATFEEYNMSGNPTDFYATYALTSDESTQISSELTTSYSVGRKSGTGVEFASEQDESGIEGSNSISTVSSYTYAAQVADTSSTYSTQSLSVSESTHDADRVWYTAHELAVYLYPILGRTVCNDDGTECDPLYLVVSGPGEDSFRSASGDSLEFFQPAWVVGNILTYPPSLDLLEQEFQSSIDLLTSAEPEVFYTDSSGVTQSITWTSGSEDGSTAGTSATHSYETTESYSDGLKYKGVGASANTSLDYGSSSGLSTLFTSTATISSSTGISIAKGENFTEPDLYQYGIEAYVFGLLATETTQGLTASADITTQGAIHLGFVANPLDDDAGAWWAVSPYADSPDVALGMPSQWDWIGEDVRTDGNCVGAFYEYDCYYFNTAGDPTSDGYSLWTQEFYWMKGLFLTSGDGAGSGPQLGQATEGDVISVGARVYNLSFKEMADDTTVRVRFYAQEIDSGTYDLVGDAILIDEIEHATVPPFGNTDGVPNYEIIRTSFDTTGYGDRYFIFWVTVWMEDGDGALVTELEGHGLTEAPGSLTRPEDCPTQPYSNNCGFYKFTFYIASDEGTEPASATVTTTDRALGATSPSVVIEEFELGSHSSPSRPLSGRARHRETKVRAHALLRAVGDAADGTVVTLTERRADGHGGEHVLEHEILAHIRPGGTHRVLLPIKLEQCGLLDLTLEVGMGAAAVTRTESVHVPCGATRIRARGGARRVPGPSGSRRGRTAAERARPAYSSRESLIGTKISPYGRSLDAAFGRPRMTIDDDVDSVQSS